MTLWPIPSHPYLSPLSSMASTLPCESVLLQGVVEGVHTSIPSGGTSHKPREA